MKLEIKFTVGDKELRIEEDVASHGELFSKLEFWDSIPRTGPNGEKDLRFVHRVHQGYDFFEVICESASQRFPFGQRKEPKGELFPKGWEPMHGHDDAQTEAVPLAPSPLANPGQVKAIHQLIEDLTKLNVKREAIIARIAETVDRTCEVGELQSEEAVKIITLLRNRLAEIKTAILQQKAGVA